MLRPMGESSRISTTSKAFYFSSEPGARDNQRTTITGPEISAGDVKQQQLLRVGRSMNMQGPNHKHLDVDLNFIGSQC